MIILGLKLFLTHRSCTPACYHVHPESSRRSNVKNIVQNILKVLVCKTVARFRFYSDRANLRTSTTRSDIQERILKVSLLSYINYSLERYFC